MTTTRRRIALILLLIVDGGFAAWGAMAAAMPDRLSGPGGKPILPAGYEGFTSLSWSQLDPNARDYMEVLFRTYGMFNLIFGVLTIAIAVSAFRRGERWAWWTLLIGNVLASVSAMTYDKTVNAIGPFELSEYLGLALVVIALAVTAPFGRSEPEVVLHTG